MIYLPQTWQLSSSERSFFFYCPQTPQNVHFFFTVLKLSQFSSSKLFASCASNLESFLPQSFDLFIFLRCTVLFRKTLTVFFLKALTAFDLPQTYRSLPQYFDSFMHYLIIVCFWWRKQKLTMTFCRRLIRTSFQYFVCIFFFFFSLLFCSALFLVPVRHKFFFFPLSLYFRYNIHTHTHTYIYIQA